MDLKDKLSLIAQALDAEPEALKPETKLEELEEWDSLAVVSVIAMLDKHFSVRLKPNESSKAFSFDLRNTDKIPDLVSRIRAEGGPIGGLVHCAGDFAVRPLRSFDPKEYRDLYDLHVTAFFMLSKAVCMKKNVDPTAASIVAVK